MYQILFDGYPIYDPRDPDLLIREPDIHLAVGEAGEASFTIDADHPYADKLTRLKGVLEVKADNLRIYKGRIRKDTLGFYLSREIATEGLLACLNDSIIPPFTFPEDFAEDEDYLAAAESGNVVQFFLGWLLDQHNSQVGPDQKIYLGDVTMADPNNYISRASSEYLTAMEVVRKKLEDLMGGYLLADYSGETTLLHYYADLPLTNTQTVEYGENLLDLISELDNTDTYTAILPIGADGLTIADLPDGEISPGIVKSGLIIYSEDAEETCGGRITRKVIWDDVTQASNLQSKAVSKLTGEGVMTTQTIEAKAVDLGATEEDIARFVVGRHVQLLSKPHDISATFPLMELEPDIFDPGNTKITMGATAMTASSIAQKNQSSTQEKVNKQQIQLDKQQSSITELSQTTKTQITEVIQTCENIIFSALESYVETSDFDEYKRTVSSELKLLSDNLTVKFTETTEYIDGINGDLQKKLETITKHFTFDIDGLTIGQVDNPYKVVIDNDEVGIYANGVIVQKFDAEGRALIPELNVTRLFNMLGYEISEDENGNINCECPEE